MEAAAVEAAATAAAAVQEAADRVAAADQAAATEAAARARAGGRLKPDDWSGMSRTQKRHWKSSHGERQEAFGPNVSPVTSNGASEKS